MQTIGIVYGAQLEDAAMLYRRKARSYGMRSGGDKALREFNLLARFEFDGLTCSVKVFHGRTRVHGCAKRVQVFESPRIALFAGNGASSVVGGENRAVGFFAGIVNDFDRAPIPIGT